MPHLSRGRSPFRHLTLFLAVTILPAVLLVVLGWLLFRQDAVTAERQLAERPASAAGVVVEALGSRLETVNAALTGPGLSLDTLAASPGTLVVDVGPAAVGLIPAGRASYTPVPTPLRRPEESAYGEGDALFWAGRQYDAAAAAYARLTTSGDAAVRAGALVRHARALRQAGRTDEALRAYERAESIDEVEVAGVPVGLLAQWARCDLLASAERTSELRAAAASFAADLERGRWSITKAVYEANVQDARMWSGVEFPSSGRPTDGELLAAVAAELWSRERTPGVVVGGRGSAGRELIVVADTPLTVIWSRTEGRLRAFVATPDFVDREWVEPVRAALALQQVRVDVRETLGSGPDAEGLQRRLPAETGLPWVVEVAATNLAEEERALASRRMLWLAGIGTLAVLLLAGTVVSARTVSRELAMARLQGDFVAAVSHEFRTPLTTMRQLTEVLGEGRLIDESRRQTYYDALTRQTNRLQRLVESLLDFGRMEAGKSPYQLEPADVSALVREVAGAFTSEAEAGGAPLDIRVSGESCAARVDRDALGHALWNLLDNARKYGPASGPIEVSVSATSGDVAISVRDRGVGIPAGEQAHVFDKFVRGAHARTESIRGTGLGLAIVAHVVAAHGGQVSVTSAPGEGSTFTITLPRAEVDVALFDARPEWRADHAAHPHR